MELSKIDEARFNIETIEILNEMPEAQSAMQSVGVKHLVDLIVRTAAKHKLSVFNESSSDIDFGYLDLSIGSSWPEIILSSTDINSIMNSITAMAAANGIKCTFSLDLNISYDVKSTTEGNTNA
jgi:hypothetical protein